MNIKDCLIIGYSWDSQISPFNTYKQNPVLTGQNQTGKDFHAAVAYLGTFLHRRELSFDYINAYPEEKQKLVEKLTENDYRLISISTTFCLNIFQIITLINVIRKYNKNSKIVLGGPFIVLTIREFMQGDKEEIQSMLSTLNADYIIDSFQGEESLVGIIKALKGELLINEVPNIIYKDASTFIHTEKKDDEFILEDNEVDWELFKDDNIFSTPIRTSISCPYSCAFCTYPLNNGKYRFISVDAIERELNSVAKLKTVKLIHFVDDALNIPKDRFKAILEMMIRNNYKFKWYSYVRCQDIDEEIIDLMIKSGCIGLLFGIESANKQILKNMNKHLEIESYKKNLKLINSKGINTFTLFIFGFPGETKETMQDTIDFIEEVKPTFYFINVWHNDPRTPINKRTEEFGIKGKNRAWVHNTMDYVTAEKLRDEAILNIKNSIPLCIYFDEIFRLMLSGQSIDEIKELCLSKLK